MDHFLEPAEVKRLTGFARPSAQIRFCRENGIRAWLSAANEVIIPWSAIDGTETKTAPEWQPDFSALQKRA